MYKQNKLQQHVHAASLGKCVLIGAGIALALISFFLYTANPPDPSWHKLWMLRPLLVVSLAGAVGGGFYFFMNPLRYQGGWKWVAANVLSLLVYIIGLWLGTVLGCAGTYWH